MLEYMVCWETDAVEHGWLSKRHGFNATGTDLFSSEETAFNQAKYYVENLPRYRVTVLRWWPSIGEWRQIWAMNWDSRVRAYAAEPQEL